MVESAARYLNDEPVALILILIGLMAYPLPLVHECGHAVMALWRTRDPIVVRVGRDPFMATLTVGRVRFWLHPWMRPGRHDALCYHRPADDKASCVLIALGGPAAAMATALAAFAVAAETHDVVRAVSVGLACVALFDVLNNLIPRTSTDQAGHAARTDGGRIVDALRGRPSVIRSKEPPSFNGVRLDRDAPHRLER